MIRRQISAPPLDHTRTRVAAFGQFFGRAPGGDLVHLLAHAGLIDRDLHDQVDDVAGDPVERQARSDSATG